MLQHRLFILTGLVLAGYSNSEGNAVTESYIPPNLDSLADVDLANVDYCVEPIVIEGLVSPSSQGASVHDDDGFNVHMFSLAAWQHPNGPIVKNKLLVLHPVSQDHDCRTVFETKAIMTDLVILGVIPFMAAALNSNGFCI